MLQIIRTGLDASNKDLAVISNNLQMQEPLGLKEVKLNFEDVFMSHHNNTTAKAKGLGVKTIKPRQNFSQGSLTN